MGCISTLISQVFKIEPILTSVRRKLKMLETAEQFLTFLAICGVLRRKWLYRTHVILERFLKALRSAAFKNLYEL